jgi:hypothetical protein
LIYISFDKSEECGVSGDQSKSIGFERKLAVYALAAGATLAGSSQADAGIVYSGPLNINIPAMDAITTDNVYLEDFNADGDPDFLIVNAILHGSGTPDTYASLTAASIGIVATDIAGSPYATPLAAGDLINGSLTADTGKAKLTVDTLPLSGISPSPWVPGTDACIGLSFSIGSELHSGWVEISIENDLSIDVLGWAYDDVANGTIKAGNNGTIVPEPSSLALLAAGASGVLAFGLRKRRSIIPSA